MTSNPYADFPAAPPGIAEWEDLLIRFELGPRIAATVLEEIPAERWSDAGRPGAWSPREHLAHLAVSEAELEAGLRALQSGEPLGGRAPEPGPGLGPDRYLDEYTRLRGRNFGAVQRRGVDVWGWAAPHPEWGTVTVYQLLSAAVRHDGHHIRRIREAC
ncbi:hypothetical protein BH23GEM5_BH23GEM5_07550 [soil metagenome]